MPFYGYGASLVIGKVLGYIINATSCLIESHKEELRKARPGAINPSEPKIIWVSLLGKLYFEKILSF